MAVNKNFVVKNGLEVATNLIIADSANKRVGIGSTVPRISLDVRGSIASTNTYTSGLSTVFTEFNVGANGEVFTVLGIGGSVGVGTQNPGFLLDVRSPVSSGQTALFVRGDTKITGNLNVDGDIFLDDVTLDQADVATLIVSSSANIVTLNVPTTATINTGIITNISGSSAVYTNITGTAVTSNAYNIGAVSVISNARQLQNIASVDATTAATIETVIQNAPNIFTDLSVPGISTLGVTSTTQLTARNLNVSGISSLGTLQNLFVTAAGISTLGTVKISSGVVTSTNGSDVAYYGDGQFLKNIVSGVGIARTGTIVGYGATVIDLRGSGIGTVRLGSGIGTVFIENTGATVSIGTVPPSAPLFPPPKVGDLWYSMNLGRTFIYYDEVSLGVGSSAFWVDSAPFNMSVLSSLDNIILAPRTASAPSIGFTTDTSTGFFSPAPGQFTVVSVGSSILNVNPSGVNVSGAMTAASLDASAGVVTASTLRGQNLTVYNVADSQGPLWARTEALIGTRNIVTNSAEVNIRQGNVDISGIVTSTSGFRGNINSSGVSTIANLQSTNINVTGISTVANLQSNTVNATGISTITNLQSTNINITGVTTVGVVTGGTSVQATNFYGNFVGSGSSLTSLPSGSIKQIKSFTYSTQVDHSGSYATTGLSTTITLSSASNKVLVIVSQPSSTTTDTIASIQLRRDVGGVSGITTLSEVAFGAYTGNYVVYTRVPVSISYLDSPGTTGITTYQTFARTEYSSYGQAASTNVNWAGTYKASTITLIEIQS